ncbi:MAG TPA: hypothetical protein VF521_14570, partial [Pyrinomonadaceae bacterium]
MNIRRFKAVCLALAVALSALCSQVRAQATAQQADEAARVERLIGLAKVWGAAKYFHPSLAYREVDWDKALVEAIPKVNAARTPQEYQAALNQMLGALGDPSTRAEIKSVANVAASPGRTNANASEPVRTEGDVLVIDATRLAEAGARDNMALRVMLGKAIESAAKARALVIDARRDGPSAFEGFASYIFADVLRQVLPQLLDSDVTLGHGRYRIHNGYATQGGGASFYYSAFADLAPQTLAGKGKTKTPIVFVVNENSPPATETLGGLQYAGRAYVVQDGERAPEAGGGSFTMDLPSGVRARLRTSESVNPDGSLDFNADAVVPKAAGAVAAMAEALKAAQEGRASQVGRKGAGTLTPLVGQKERPYAEMEYPSAEYRLLALFRYWN